MARGVVFKTVHRTNPAPDFPKDPLNDIGRPDSPGMLLGAVQKSQHFRQVFLQTLHDLRLKIFPGLFPFQKPLFGLLLIFRQVNELGSKQTFLNVCFALKLASHIP